jgi:uncharacterized hydrophobic protein (TIGR00271 family)
MRDTQALTPLPPPPGRGAPPPPRRSAFFALQDWLAALFGVAAADRIETVRGMLARRRGWAAGYWLQLLLALAIATLGLLLGSTAVVIGAMLVSPLMTPIIELGMGLAIGSPLLVVRSSGRVGGSVLVVVASAAAITMVVPIHEVTSEITARTSPTLLDLAVASCCAIAAVYAVVRAGSDTASAAAGTAIGIALVPPLCVTGYGLGTSGWSIATGAALLFTANFCAILLFSVLAFLLLGYGHVGIGVLEREHIDQSEAHGFVARLARRLSAFFASRLGPAVRIAMPVLLAASVYVPLRTALAEVTWEVRARAATQEALGAIAQPSVQSTIRVERHRVVVRLVAIGTEADAATLKKRLADRIRAAAGVDPDVDVVAVPDAAALARAQDAATDRDDRAPPALPEVDLAPAQRALERALGAWPTEASGPLLAWRLSLPNRGDARVDVLHLGPPLGPAAVSLLASALSSALHATVRIGDVALNAEPLVVASAAGAAWLARAVDALEPLRAFPDAEVSACIVLPPYRESDGITPAAVTAFADPRVALREGDTFRLHWSASSCAPAGDAGSADGAPPGDAR